ncbi:ATP-dependent nuclease [Pseudomonas koreensis]|uniref:ATP-dependent nuclease n=1 Tax=Pseudomonas koreensis TaxID=198620 RepID=UPI0009ECD2B6|nr:AAA family ATPase [Pseudomonas koreensis]
MATITIENLRHIAKMEFEIPRPGVWLLTGSNGTGKTSLLGCLRRIGYKNAFPVHFPTSRKSDRLDSNEGASISYTTPQGPVSYKYKTERWVPTPKSHSSVLSSLGYPDVVYIAADADRIEPRKEDFSPSRVKSAAVGVIEAANQIFSTDKFNQLKTINVRRGVGSHAFLLELPTLPKQPKRYFSEKNLSLGELCILKLLRTLNECRRGSLILIDEVELALHPTAQAELLSYLQKIADDKSLTIIVSTHSATLIKQSPRKKIMFLQSDSTGNISCSTNCYPSYVLGILSYQEESASDVLIYVEDDAARIIVEQLAQKFIASAFAKAALIPSVNVIPVGGITNVLRFFVRQKPLLPAITRTYVVLDADAEESLKTARAEDIVRICRDEVNSISFLPFTPEVGVCDLLHRRKVDTLQSLKQHFSLNTLSFRGVNLGGQPNPQTPGIRDVCKVIVDSVCDHLSDQLPNASSLDVRNTLMKLLAEDCFNRDRATIMQQFGPIIRG